MPISTASGARSGVAADSRTPSSAACSSASVITRSEPPVSVMASSKSALARGVEGRVDSVGDRAHVGEEVAAVEHRRGSELSSERLVCAPTAPMTLSPCRIASCVAMMPDGATRAEDQQSLALVPRRAGAALRRRPQPTRAARRRRSTSPEAAWESRPRRARTRRTRRVTAAKRPPRLRPPRR